MDTATRQERRDISLQIWKLETERCEECVGYVPHGGAMRCKCATAAKIRALGDKLIAISARTRQGRMDALIKKAQDEGLTMELYQLFREQGLTDNQVWKAIGMKEADYYDWKFEQGLITERRKVRKDVPVNRKKHGITKDQFKQAADKGIPRDMVRGRRNRGWSVERSLTEPPHARKAQYAVWEKIAVSNGVTPGAFKSRIRRGKSYEEAATRPPNARRKKVGV